MACKRFAWSIKEQPRQSGATVRRPASKPSDQRMPNARAQTGSGLAPSGDRRSGTKSSAPLRLPLAYCEALQFLALLEGCRQPSRFVTPPGPGLKAVLRVAVQSGQLLSLQRMRTTCTLTIWPWPRVDLPQCSNQIPPLLRCMKFYRRFNLRPRLDQFFKGHRSNILHI